MIAAVSRESEVVDHLAGYLSRSKRNPTFVSGRPAQARKPNAPGESIPGEDGKVAASSARPWKTNTVVPYPRLVFSDDGTSAEETGGVLPGDLLFVNRWSGASGHDANRVCKVASLRQINHMLRSSSVNGSGFLENPVSPWVLLRMKEARELRFRDLEERVKRENAALKQLRDSRPGAGQAIAGMEASLVQIESELDQAKTSKENCSNGKAFDWNADWQAVALLQEWTPDGVLINRDDDERGSDWFAAGGGDSGFALNVAVQGPAMLRNAAGDAEQLIDASLSALDDVLLLLVCTPKEGKRFEFQYKVCSRRLALRLAQAVDRLPPGVQPPSAPAAGGTVSELDISLAAAAWKIGRVLDTQLVPGRAVRVNVAVQQVDLAEATGEHAPGSGLGKGLNGSYDTIEVA